MIISIFSMYLFDSYSGNYEDSFYKLKIDSHTYNLKDPSQRWDLPNELEEVSGLSYYSKNHLACIQDEDGFFYIYDLKKNEIVRKDQFGKKGDYEGVEVIKDTAYVLKSNGEIFYFHLKKKGIGEVKNIKTDLNKRNDAEGLGFHEGSNELLITCKEEPGTKKVDIESSRAIVIIPTSTRYSFSYRLPKNNTIKNPTRGRKRIVTAKLIKLDSVIKLFF